MPTAARNLIAVFVIFAATAFGETVEMMDGSRVDGQVAAISPEGILAISADGNVRKIPCDEVLAIEFAKVTPRPKPGQALVMLHNGDILIGRITGGSKSALTLATGSMGNVEIAFDHVRAVEFDQRTDPPKPGDAPRSIAPELLDAASDRDAVLLLNGDRLPGVLQSVGNAGIQFDCALGDIPLGFDKMLGIALAPGAEIKAPDGLIARVVTVDGAVVSGAIKQLDARQLRIRPIVRDTIDIPRAAIAGITFSGGRIVYLSDLEPAKVVEEPFVRAADKPAGDNWWWHYRRDRNVNGGPIVLAKRRWRKGLGVHSRCELTYTLGGKYSRLLTTFGIDDEARGAGHVTFKIVGDGKTLYPAKPQDGAIAGGDEPRKIDISVEGVAQVTLVVDFGENMHIFDRADWAGARLILK